MLDIRQTQSKQSTAKMNGLRLPLTVSPSFAKDNQALFDQGRIHRVFERVNSLSFVLKTAGNIQTYQH